MGQLEILDELLIRGRFLDRVEVGTVEILDERVLQRRVVVGVPYERRDGLEADPAGGPPSALARDELVLVAHGTHKHRLEEADLADRLGE